LLRPFGCSLPHSAGLSGRKSPPTPASGERRDFWRAKFVGKIGGHSACGEGRASLYQEVTDRIIAELEQGRVPWVQPWGKAQAGLGLPKNACTGRRYSGVNILILWGAVIEKG
jgi:hypothetical protein